MPETNENNNQDYTQHRQLINHALKGEPAQMGPIFGQLIASKISDAIEIRRGEIGAALFTSSDED